MHRARTFHSFLPPGHNRLHMLQNPSPAAQGALSWASQHPWCSLQVLSHECKAVMKWVLVHPYTCFCTLFSGQLGCRLWAGPGRALYLLDFLLLAGCLASSRRKGHVSPACSRKGFNICSPGRKKATIQGSHLFSILTWSQKSQLVFHFPRCLWSLAPPAPAHAQEWSVLNNGEVWWCHEGLVD